MMHNFTSVDVEAAMFGWLMIGLCLLLVQAFFIGLAYVFVSYVRSRDRRHMDPSSERRGLDNGHVRQWKIWYCLEGRHFDNANRHPDHQLPDHTQTRFT